MIKVHNLKISFGAQVLFDNVRFTINRKERIGLVGRNGSGKTTLFNMLYGKITPDTGLLSIPKNYSIGYVEQNLWFTKSTALEEGCRGLKPEYRDDVWKVEKVLSGLGFTIQDMNQNPQELSGGFQVRLNLVKVLVAEHDLLLLDEPTNYLDIVSIRWLSSFLHSWPKELMLITHDRGFMDSIITHAMLIHRKKIKKIVGTTAKLYEQIVKEEEIYEKTRLNDEKKRKGAELFINRFRAKARLAGLVQSRIKSLQKKEKPEKLERIQNLDFSFTEAPFPAKYLMEVKDISFAYHSNSPPLLHNFSLAIRRNDRIGITGKNGTGKSTLLKLLSGEIQPSGGRVKSHQSLVAGYFGQIAMEQLNPLKTIEKELASADQGAGRKKLMDICGSMMFGGDLSQKKISVLSGGEKSRVLLGKILLTPANLLLLDEPTNHLDMESCDSLLAAIDSFPGAVIIVTHNEMFLNTLVNRLIIFEQDSVAVFEGTYQDFLEKVGWKDEKHRQNTLQSKPKHSANKTTDRKDLKRRRAEVIVERSRALKPIEMKIKKTETTIEALEEKIHKNNLTIIEASRDGRGEVIGTLSVENHALQNQIDTLYQKLDEMLQSHEIISADFDKLLENVVKDTV